jgi:hypothetical protein
VEIQGHPVDEACFVIRGSVILTDSDGRSGTFKAGEGFLLPRGFRGIWSQSDGFANCSSRSRAMIQARQHRHQSGNGWRPGTRQATSARMKLRQRHARGLR